MRLLVLITTLIIALYQSMVAKNHYELMQRGGNSVYYIYPQKIGKIKESIAVRPLLADFTYASSSDSVAITVSSFIDRAAILDSIKITSGNTVIEDRLEKLFVEPSKGKSWVGRYRIYIPFYQFQELFSTPAPYTIDLFSASVRVSYRFSKKEWTKTKERVTQVINIINLNKDSIK